MNRERGYSSSGAAGSSRHSHEGKHGRHGKEHGRKHHRESRREKVDPYLLSSAPNNGDEMQTSAISGTAAVASEGQRSGGGFEMGIPSSTSRTNSTSSWFQESPADQATPHAPPTYLSALSLPTTMSETGMSYSFSLKNNVSKREF